MRDEATWTEDVCTCGHAQSEHAELGKSSCKVCLDDAHWARTKTVCRRFQWNGEPRRRTW